MIAIFQVESLNKLMMKINEDLIKTSKHALGHELMHSTIEVYYLKEVKFCKLRLLFFPFQHEAKIT